MNIAYLCADFGIPIHGDKGASIHVRALSQALHDAGHHVAIHSPRVGGSAPAGFTVPVTELALPRTDRMAHDLLRDDPMGGPATAREVRAMLYASTMRHELGRRFRDRPPDAIYERYALLATAGGDLARELGVPHIVEVNAPLSDEQEQHRGLSFGQSTRALERRILSLATHLVAVSGPLRDWLTGIGIDPDAITVLPNAVDADHMARGFGQGAGLRRRLGLGEAPVVGFVGTLKGWHGTYTLVRAFARVALALEPAARPRLLIVGEGPQRETLEAVASEAGIAGLAVFAGAVPHADMPAWLDVMDIAVAPYDRQPGHYFSPLKLFEYMAAGRAIVAADIGQASECIDHGDTGLLYEPGDIDDLASSLRHLLDEPAHGAAMGRAAQVVARTRHTWRRNAEIVAAMAAQGMVRSAGIGMTPPEGVG